MISERLIAAMSQVFPRFLQLVARDLSENVQQYRAEIMAIFHLTGGQFCLLLWFVMADADFNQLFIYSLIDRLFDISPIEFDR